jgi:hydrogenase maturation protease
MTIVVFTWGNPSRGDDGVGPWFADYLGQLKDHEAVLVEDFQLQIEHLLDCQVGELLLFIDACCHAGQDFHFEEVELTTDIAHTSHALTPAQLLGNYRRVFDTSPPTAFQLTIAGSTFELGQPMSAATQARCYRATGLLHELLRKPDITAWRALAGALLESGDA